MLAYREENNKIVELLEYGNEEQLEQFPNFIATDKEIIQNLQGEFVFKDTLTDEEIAQINGAFLHPTRDIKAELLASVDNYLNTTVQARGYDSILSACSYAFAQADETFQAEGQKALEWRSLVYRKCYDIMAQVEAGERNIPTEEELLNELPVLEW